MSAYYNEFDPDAAAWLRDLIKRGLIADGEVDERSIIDVSADDVRGFTQCHFFAGIGGWSYALRLAGWPDDEPVWTGSPPCQPFSSAGKQKGKDDERHLAPHFAKLISEGRPQILFGEQVASSAVFGKPASKTKRGSVEAPEWSWIDDLSGRLEATHYAIGASDIPAAGIGAPHIRQRTFFGAVRLGDSASFGSQMRQYPDPECNGCGPDETSNNDGLADTATHANASTSREIDSPWRDADWLFCRDGKWRPVESGTFPLAHGVSARVGRLRGYGNAIVPQAAATFIQSFKESINGANQ